jgi:hypothetical protein
MRRTFLTVIFGFILISSVIVYYFADDVDQEIHILSIKKDYARVLTEEEVIDIPIYLTSNQSFITSINNITQTMIISEQDQMSVEISDIVLQDHRVIYDTKEYYLFHFSVDFSNLYSKNLSLDMPSAKLKINYDNEEEFSFDLGDVQILFHDFEQNNHIDFNRMYATYKQGSISSIVLDIENKTSQHIQIKNIETLNHKMKFNLSYARIKNSYSEHLDTIDDILPDFQIIVNQKPQQASITLYQDTQYILPIQHIEALSYLNRFPLIIHYQYNHTDYIHIIDDYIFFKPISDLVNNTYEIEQYQYHY